MGRRIQIGPKMFMKFLCTIIVALVLQKAQCANPPKITKSYIAWGEITERIEDLDNQEIQVAFEESYDADNDNSAFTVWMNGKNVTYVQNFQTGQTFAYVEGKDCDGINQTEWIKSDFPPGLLAFEDNNGRIKFSLRQLFNLPEKYLRKDKSDVPGVFRGIPARRWEYEITGKNDKERSRKLFIYSYWSDGKWNTSSNEETIPLGFIVTKTGYYVKSLAIEEIFTSVFGFVTGTYDRKSFEPFQGVVCPDRSQTLKFPVVKNINAVSIHSEMVLPDYQEIKYIDTYFDPRNQLVRIDVQRMREEDPIAELKTKRYESEIAIGKMGVVFRQSTFKDSFTCEVIPFKDYKNDLQNFFDVKQDLKKWRMEKLLGLNDTEYVFTGKTVKGDIPCNVFQGIRNDWPEESANVTSLWEWCFNVNMSQYDTVLFADDEVGLISVQITILTSDKPEEYAPGFRMFHHFYEITKSDPAILDSTKFDIASCFKDSQRRAIQFYLDIKIDGNNRDMVENLTSDLSFIQKWKAAIYRNTELPDYSLRVTRLTSTINDNKLYIKFLILNDHPNLPAGIWVNQISAFDAEEKLRRNVNQGSVSITHTVDKTPLTFKAAKHSVSLQINPNFDHHSLTTTPTPSTEASTSGKTRGPFTLITEPKTGSDAIATGSTGQTMTGSTEGDSSTGTGPITDKPPETTTPGGIKRVVKKFGHGSGTVAAVSISMILIGISIGSASTFYKFYGLPPCLRRRE